MIYIIHIIKGRLCIIYIMQTGATGAVETTCISQTGSIGADEERHTRQ